LFAEGALLGFFGVLVRCDVFVVVAVVGVFVEDEAVEAR
jgi:hypothetical protein